MRTDSSCNKQVNVSEHQQLFFSAESHGRGSALHQKGITDTHPPSVDPFSPSVQQKRVGGERMHMIYGGKIDKTYS